MTNLLKPNFNYYECHKKHYKRRLLSTSQTNTLFSLTSQQESQLQAAYSEYENLFNLNQLNRLVKYSFFNQEEKSKYLFLYDYSLKYFKDIKQSLRYLDNTKVVDCPFCEHGKPTTLDHIVPKSVEGGFPEFCDNPLNLIPMCQSCNGKKGSIFCNTNGELELINLYRDILPNNQYLKVDIQINNNIPEIHFYIDKNVISDIDLARRIENTYDYLNLCTFYDDLSANKITTLKTQVLNMKNTLNISRDNIKAFLSTMCPKENYWEDVLLRKIVNDDVLFDIIYN